MKLTVALTSLALAATSPLLTLATPLRLTSGPQPQEQHDRDTLRVTKVTIPSRLHFATTRAAWEAQLPPINYTYRDLLHAGDVAGARAALAYEVGNPFTATRVNRFVMDSALYALWRVLLLEEYPQEQQKRHKQWGAAGGNTNDSAPSVGPRRVWFEVDSPTGVWGQFNVREIDDVARELEEMLRAAMIKAAGRERDYDWL
ncbi:hypothetical protein MAPG_07147 [Magnaporthiopsis poae ATCC 64411]|uniref:Uncharacterized protein n=1 Tax=Magnaporthiopsis poae (strain ATCC 64411 / 73-15) TaxID=644358 RepID=A0A0C4E3X0_MAGP6|nr:hypothetical protein MAPG_07147 [Magnaporthiopsis poae ATCC 64411]